MMGKLKVIDNKIKQVIVIRKDLHMRKGKMVAQGAHASMGAIMHNSCFFSDKIVLNPDPDVLDWLKGTFTKICVSVDSEKELLELYDKAEKEGLNLCLIKDNGLTEFNNIPTLTALAIGPNKSDRIDPITGHLKLL